MNEQSEAIVRSQSPGDRNPNKLRNLRPGQGGEARKKHSRSLANKLRRYLESPKGTDREGRNRRDRIFATLVEIAENPKHPHAVAAAQLLFDRGYGKLKPSDEELEGSKGIQIVYVDNSSLADVPLQKEEPPEPKPDFPDFIDAEIVPNR